LPKAVQAQLDSRKRAERLEMKHKIFNDIQTHCHKDALIGFFYVRVSNRPSSAGGVAPKPDFSSRTRSILSICCPLIELVGGTEHDPAAHTDAR